MGLCFINRPKISFSGIIKAPSAEEVTSNNNNNRLTPENKLFLESLGFKVREDGAVNKRNVKRARRCSL